MLTTPAAPWPATSEGLAVAVAGADKERDAFASLWDFVRESEAGKPRQTDLFSSLDLQAWARAGARPGQWLAAALTGPKSV